MAANHVQSKSQSKTSTKTPLSCFFYRFVIFNEPFFQDRRKMKCRWRDQKQKKTNMNRKWFEMCFCVTLANRTVANDSFEMSNTWNQNRQKIHLLLPRDRWMFAMRNFQFKCDSFGSFNNWIERFVSVWQIPTKFINYDKWSIPRQTHKLKCLCGLLINVAFCVQHISQSQISSDRFIIDGIIETIFFIKIVFIICTIHKQAWWWPINHQNSIGKMKSVLNLNARIVVNQ